MDVKNEQVNSGRKCLVKIEKNYCVIYRKKNLEGFFISFSQVSVGLNKHTIQRHHPEFAEI